MLSTATANLLEEEHVGLHYENLDDATRKAMLAELEDDIRNGVLYRSPRLLDSSWDRYQVLLRHAFESGTDDSLASAIRTESLLKTTEQRRKPKGGFTTADVPWTAADTLAEGEFNRFYARGLCRRAKDEGVAVGRAVTLQVYRAKQVEKPREASERLVGQSLDADTLLGDLRRSIGVDPALGLPAGPNSGLSVRLRLA